MTGANRDVDRRFRGAADHFRHGRLAETEQVCRAILADKVDHADSLHLLGLIAQQRGDDRSAVELISQAIATSGTVAAFHSSLGALHGAARRFDAAIACFSRALDLAPSFAAAHYNLGCAFQSQGMTGDAGACFERALALNPDTAAIHNNLGIIRQAEGRREDAAGYFAQAAALDPTYAEAHNNLGTLRQAEARLSEAAACLQRALTLKPDYPEAHNNLGNVWWEMGRPEEAIDCFERAIALAPSYAKAHNNLMMALNYAAAVSDDERLAKARRFAANLPASPHVPFANPPDPDRKLRIGYVSGDFCRHPVSYFLAGVLPSHDPAAVEIYCYANDGGNDAMSERLRRAAAGWCVVAGLTDDETAAVIRRDGIDVLVDLSGHTAKNRLAVFALRPAPVQVSWLGYCGTTGLAAMDYLLADPIVVPKKAERAFTETIWRLPRIERCFWPGDIDLPPSAAPAPGDVSVTFGCFNNRAKLSPATLKCWARLLKRVEGSRLLIKTRTLADPLVRQELAATFAALGIAADRLTLEGASPRAEALAAYGRVDIALDPFPYCGCTTTAETLWMGVPVVTLRGESWAGRVGETILAAVGLDELIAADVDDYVNIAAGLAGDFDRLAVLRVELRPRMQASPLCDALGFARDIEAAFRGMWRIWCAASA